ncbi:MAG: hypothetical protein HQK55_15955, partial [Deltaproteobacteria bacterium]|nr:hypothetical protein [Deltaproteobacteria bacterium]
MARKIFGVLVIYGLILGLGTGVFFFLLSNGNMLNREAMAMTDGNIVFEAFTDQHLGLSLQKPKGWPVRVEGGKIFLQSGETGSAKIILIPLVGFDSKANALGFLRTIADAGQGAHPDLRLTEIKADKNQTLAT